MFEGKKMSNFKLPKWAVVMAATLVFLLLAIDWVSPEAGTRLAMGCLEGATSPAIAQRTMFPLWRWLVGMVGKNYESLTAISVCAGMVCVWLVAAIFGAIFGAAVRGAKEGVAKGEGKYAWVESAAVLLAGFAFALTPGFLNAATRVSPLMVALVPPLAAVALVAGVASHGGSTVRMIERLKNGKWRLLLAVGLVGYSAFELTLARRVLLALALPALWVWLAVGAMPALVIAWCVRKRWLSGRKELYLSFGAWTAAVLVMGATNFTLGTLDRGRVASRIAAQIVANAEADGKIAIVSDGMLDGLFFFTLPEKMRVISLAREYDPAYGRELSDWVNGLAVCTTNNYNADLAFAAELGPQALLDDWTKFDKAGLDARVMTAPNYFPTREKWDAACAAIKDLREDEPLAGYLRHLVAVCGNGLGCRLIESGDEKGAWEVFKTIVYTVEPKNYGAFLNLHGMVQRGFSVPEHEAVELTALRQLRQQLEQDFKGEDSMLRAVRSSGLIYTDPKEVEEYEKRQRELAEKRELTPEARAFVQTVADAPKDPKRGKAAQEAIYRALREGLVGIEGIGGHLVTIDLAIGDVENAEKDALSVLRANRSDPTANAALGLLAGVRGDLERAERYLRRAIATGKASVAAKNDLAYVLFRQGRLDEAEAMAREAVKTYDGHWTFHETLAVILINKGRLDEGERELERAEQLVQEVGLEKEKVTSLMADRALLMKKRKAVE